MHYENIVYCELACNVEWFLETRVCLEIEFSIQHDWSLFSNGSYFMHKSYIVDFHIGSFIIFIFAFSNLNL